MAATQDWPDVRLLAFDLITVKFAYAASQTLALTCTHPLLPGGGSYDLRFGCSSSDDHNPHVAAEPFLRGILRHGPELTRSLRTLVGLLRDTLPIVSALASFAAAGIETAVKGPSWYRILYEGHR
jgi:mediator of RNA polymerase II transcription subunit 14